MKFSISKRPLNSVIYGVVSVGLALLVTASVSAQSGRRAPKGTTTVPTVSGPKPVEKKTVPTKDTRTSLLLSIEDHNPFSGIPYYLAGTVLDTCANRLRASPDIKVDSAAKGMSRGEAVKLAKSQPEAYVVWLQIDSDSFDTNRTPSLSPDSLFIRYTIFTPVTGKIKASGRTYKQIYSTGKGGVLGRIPSSRGGDIYSEYALKEAAREAAEQILDVFKINIPKQRVPG